MRSAGITDLRHGNLVDADWAGRGSAHRLHVPLPDGVRYFAMAASTGLGSGDLKDRLLGNGLVPLAIALGPHAQPARNLAFAPERQ